MTTQDTASLDAFRREVQQFLDTAPTEEIREAGRKTTSAFAPFDVVMKWQKLLYEQGWAAPGWPEQYGGTGWSMAQRFIYAQEYAKRALPPLLPNGLRMLGPLLMEAGTEAQKEKYLERILSGEDFWAQGYSEPESGSDLASLRCRAVRDGDHYVINGEKIWTTYAFKANRMFMLVRTDAAARKQHGITFLLLDDLKAPSLTIRPIVGLDGQEEQCQVFFKDVRVPVANRVGLENEGWAVAKALLKHERGGGEVASPMLRHRLMQVRARWAGAAEGEARQRAPWPPDWQVAWQQLMVRVQALECMERMERMRLGGSELADGPAMASVTKIVVTELTQDISHFMVRACGMDAMPLRIDELAVGAAADDAVDALALVAMPFYLNSRATTLYAGSNEIQRDVIARLMTRSH